jgi:hypothetical protein
MKILGIGDSFMAGSRHDKNPNYLHIVSEKLNADYTMCGMSGAGPWNTFFKFLDYENKNELDVVIFAWSEYTRLYHPDAIPLNTGTVLYGTNRTENADEIYKAANYYYQYLFDYRKLGYEAKGLYYMIDDMAKEYPHIKFIHMYCFAHQTDTSYPHMEMYEKPNYDHLEYLYTFKNGINIHPALMYLSFQDGQPEDLKDDAHSGRSCHLTPKMHVKLADTLLDAINNGVNGDLFYVKV